MDVGQVTTVHPPSLRATTTEFRTRNGRCGWRGMLGVVALMIFPGVVIPVGTIEAVGPDPCVVTQTLAITNSVAPSPTPAFGAPYDVEIDTSGNIYVSDAGSDSAYWFDSAGSQTLHVGSLWDADGIAVDSAGNFYVGTGGGSLSAAIRKFDASGTQVAAITGFDVQGQLGQGFANPRGIVVDEANGFVYFADARVYRVASDLDPTTVTVFVDTPTPSPEFNSVGGVAVDPSGNVIVGGNTEVTTGVYSGVVWVFDPGGVQQMAITSGLTSQTWGVAVDDSGRIFVADADADAVYGFEPDGTLFLTLDNSSSVPDPAFARPRGVDVTPDGRYLYVADADSDAVYEFMLRCDMAIRASVTNDWVQGDGFAADTNVDVWVTESDGVTVKGSATVTSDGSGHFEASRDQLGADIVSGDRVFADDAITQKDVAMGFPLSIDVVADPPVAFGDLPSGETVLVHVEGTTCSADLPVADADDGSTDGSWSLDFSAACPGGLGLFPNGSVSLPDADGDATVAESPPELRIVSSSMDNWIEGHGFAPDASVDIWIDAAGPPTMSVGTDYSGSFHADPGTDLVPGNVIDVSDGVDARNLVIAGPLSIDVDPGPPVTAWGELPTGDGVQLFAWGADCPSSNAFVLDDDDGTEDGTWSADLTAPCPAGLGPDHGAVALHFDADGDITHARVADPPGFQASVTSEWVSGHGFTPDASVDIWVDADPLADPASGTAGTDSQGQFHWDSGMDLMFGQTIVVTDYVTERTLILTGPLSIDGFDPALMTAFGTLPTGGLVNVQMGGEDCGTGMQVADSDDGTEDAVWSADLSGGDCPGGLGANPGASVMLYDADGDATVAEPPQPPTIRASVSNNWVEGHGFAPNSPVELWLDADPLTDPPTDTVGTDGGGYFQWNPPFSFAFGNEIVAADGVIERYLLLEGPLSIEVDGPTATAIGELPPGAGVEVQIGGQSCGSGVFVNDSDDGSDDGLWFADVSGDCPGGLGPDASGQVYLYDADGDATVAEPSQPPQIRVSVTGDWMEGYGFMPDSPVGLWVNADPLVDPPTAEAQTDSGGSFNWGFDFDLAFDDEVVASDGVIERYLLLQGPLSIEADLDAMTANGELPVGAYVGVEMNGDACGGYDEVADGDDGFDDGVWSIDMSVHCPGGLGANAWARVLLYDADGDATVAAPPQPPQIQASVTSQWLQGWGFVANGSVDVWVDADPLIDPATDTVGTDGGGYFQWNPPFPIGFGNEIVASDGVIERYLLLEGPLSIDVDGPSATAFGGLPVGAAVYAEFGGNDCGAGADVADIDDGLDDGLWFADVSGDCPGGLGDNFGGQVYLFDADRDATVAEPVQPPQIQANPAADSLQGFGFAPNSPVDVWIDSDPLLDPPTDTVGTGGDGSFWFNPSVEISVGDAIHVTDGAIVRELLVEGPLSIDVDGPSATAFGELPVGAAVYAEFGGDDCGAGADVADIDDGLDDGLWFADVSGDCPGGLGDNFGGQVYLFDGDGDATVAEPFPPPQIRASVTNYWIQGWGFAPDGSVDVWIDGDPLLDPPTGTAGTNDGGNFQYDPPFAIGSGTEITVDDGVTERYLLLEGPLSIDVDGPTATAFGELPVDAAVRVEFGGDDCGAAADVADIDDGLDDGLWFADVSGDCPGGLGDNLGGQVLLFDGDGDATVAEPRQPASFQASVTDDWINGQGFAPNSTVDLWVEGNSATEPPLYSVGTDGGGQFWSGSPVDLLFGDTIVASDGITEKLLVLTGPLSIEFDPIAVTASGELPLSAEIGVDLQGNSCGTGTMLADADDGSEDGLWSVDLSGACPGGLGPNAWAQASIGDDDGDATFVSAPRPPRIVVSADDDWIGGDGFAPDSPVDVWIMADPTLDPPTDTVGTDGGGSFWFGAPIDLQVGDYVAASDGVVLRELVLEGPLAIDVDHNALVASGVLPLGAGVQIEINGMFCGAAEFVFDGDDGSEDGSWGPVDLSSQCPSGLGPDTWARVSLFDADGDASISYAAPAPQIGSSVDRDWIGGQGFTPDTIVDVWVEADPVTDPPTASVMSDGSGQFWMDPIDLGSIDLLVGDQIVASDGVIERTLVLEGPLSITADYATLTATGALPAGDAVLVRANGYFCGSGAFVHDADDGATDGVFHADVSADCPGGLGPDAWMQVLLFDDDGDATVAEAQRAPEIQASEQSDSINGQGFAPNTAIDVWVNTDPALPPTASTTSDRDGHWWIDPSMDLAFGDVVIATDGVITRQLTLEGPLSIVADFDAVTASGDLPLGAVVRVSLNGQGCGADAFVSDGDDGTEDGVWHVDLSGQCGSIGLQPRARVSLYDDDFDATVADATPPARIFGSVDSDWVGGSGFAPNTNVEIWIDGPLVKTILTDGEGNFWTDSGLDLVGGTEIEMSDGSASRHLVLEAPLSISIDLDAATAQGMLPLGATVEVTLNGSNCGFHGAIVGDGFGVDEDGLWSLDVSAYCPDGLGADWGSIVNLYDGDGDATVADSPPAPRIAASVTFDWIEGYDLAPSAPAQIRVNGDLVATIVTDGGGGFYVESPGLGGIDLVLGDVVVVSDGATTKTLSLDGPMTIDVIAGPAGATGTLPVGARTYFSLFNSACGDLHNMQADDGADGAVDGVWALDLTTECPGGLGTGWDAQIDRYDSDGDLTIVMWVPAGDGDGDGLTDADERNIYGTDPAEGDSDGDGLTDGAEVLTHLTDPNDSDSDDDGLSDGAEVSTYTTNPKKSDTDGDGLTDGAEVLTHLTDPNKPDTDGDGLSDGAEVNTHATDPNKPDTDNDGLEDGEEVNVYNTKPLKPDTDGGTVNDGDEVANGTDPLDPDDDIAGPPLEPLVPARVLETRMGPNDVTYDGLFQHLGRQPAGSTLELLIAGRGGVPADAEAVIMNLTAVFPSAPGYLTVFPCGAVRPKASNVNYAAGDVAPNAVLAKIGTGGKVCIFTLAETDMIADVNGFVPVGGSPGSLVPARVLETRMGPNDLTYDGLFQHLGRQPAGSTLELLVAGRGGVPVDAEAVMLNLTAVFPSGPGYLTVFPCGAARPKASNVNYAAGDVAPNAVLAKIGTGGKVCIFTLAETDMIADVNGYVPVGGSPGSLVPARVLETRMGPNDVTYDGLFQHLGRQSAGSTLELLVAGRGGVPVDAEAVMLNVTAVFPSAPGYLTVFPCGTARPKASNVNYAAGQVAPNAVLAKIGTDGKVCIFTLAETDIVVDVLGYV